MLTERKRLQQAADVLARSAGRDYSRERWRAEWRHVRLGRGSDPAAWACRFARRAEEEPECACPVSHWAQDCPRHGWAS